MQTVIQQHPDQFTAEVDNDVLMMHPETGEYFGLNAVAGYIWKLAAEPRTVAEICAAVQAEFEVDESRCVDDTRTFLEQMLEAGLLTASETSQPARDH